MFEIDVARLDSRDEVDNDNLSETLQYKTNDGLS